MDTGAKCNTLTLDSNQFLRHSGELKCSKRVLRLYTNHKLKPVAAVELLVKCKNCDTNPEFEIVNIAQGN